MQNAQFEQEQNNQPSARRILATLLAWVLILSFGVGLLFNLFVITTNILNQNGHATAFGVTPIVVLKGEEDLDDFVSPGQLLFAFEKDLRRYDKEDRVAFRVNDRIFLGEIESGAAHGGVAGFRVRAVYAEQAYDTLATEKNLLGEIALRLPLLGYVVLFMASLPGKLLLVGVPLLVYIILLLIMEAQERRAALPAPESQRKRRLLAPDGTGLGNIPFWVYLYTAMISTRAIVYGTSGGFSIERKPKKTKKRSTQKRDKAPKESLVQGFGKRFSRRASKKLFKRIGSGLLSGGLSYGRYAPIEPIYVGQLPREYCRKK